ncbi:hypothetical protein A3F02_03470 [Candidatus Curtissbacteria bacterium RIFCSPHIGHO2_12_FULL_38_9b]|uniref:Uncharacterized protein n=1 Tax=Candidatus Curtissbacteria bacterium RIFCSPHIGHO2_12_FULL_38_9b TaxID=1797720 RepID=A0A1F5GZJ9_9BACT|nr:MAG: hypothetical protein A3F02_03470 [Candidatus Curtissbacteria bacterium RIFCSPHIGHO2_12_FULL_38_9b]
MVVDLVLSHQHKKIALFVLFLAIAVVMSVIEDIFVVILAAQATINLRIILLIFAISIPFAAFSELVVDKIYIPILGRKLELFLEFLIFGIIIGIIEDLLAILVATSSPITLKTIGIITLIAIPFAILSELIVDRMDLIPPGDNPKK